MGNLKGYIKIKKEKKQKRNSAITFDKVINIRTPQIESLDGAVKGLQDKYNTKELPIIVNQFIFFKIIFRDILVAMKQLQGTTDTFELNSVTRSLALHLYEFLDDTKDFLGQKMRESLIFMNLPNLDFLIKDLNDTKEIYKALKNNIFKGLAEIRHNTVAHKEQNSIILNNKIKSISQREIEIYAVLSFILFITINQFQNNIISSIDFVSNKHLEISKLDKQEIEKIINNELKLRSAKAEYNRIMIICLGIDPAFADALCEYSSEDITKIKKKLDEIVDFLKQKKSSS